MSAPPSRGRILILGGTGEARQLAVQLDRDGLAVTTSLAGRLAAPRLPAGEVRIGGFGGADALATWLGAHEVAAVIDATHPFATRISEAAATACESVSVPYLRLERPGWTEQPGDRWHRVSDLAGAASLVPGLGQRVLLAIGRQGVSAFARIEAAWFLIRCIEPPAPPMPPHHQLLLDRGPFALAGELALIDAHRIDLLVTKDSGGPQTEAKLAAARARGLPVIIVRRPARPGSQSVADVQEAVAWMRRIAAGRDAGPSAPGFQANDNERVHGTTRPVALTGCCSAARRSR